MRGHPCTPRFAPADPTLGASSGIRIPSPLAASPSTASSRLDRHPVSTIVPISTVILGLDPRIHAFAARHRAKTPCALCIGDEDVGGRVKPGHDGGGKSPGPPPSS